MKKDYKYLRVLSLLMFSFGVLIGMAVAGGIVWGDFEAFVFDPSIQAESSLRLNCPVVITTDEVGKISATLKNTVDREKNFFVRAHISEGYVSLMRQIDQNIYIAPGETGKVEWEIFPEDAAFNRIILFRTYVFPSYPMPSQGSFCGVIVLNIPLLTGTQFFLLMLGLSLVCIIGGILVWKKINQPMNKVKRSLINAMYALVVIIYATILAGYMGLWILGVLLFASSILMVGIILGRNILAPS
jgi:hypothetical protein